MKEKIIPALIIAAAAGIGTAIFLQTEEGKKILEKLESITRETLDDITERWAKLNMQLADKFVNEVLMNEDDAFE